MEFIQFLADSENHMTYLLQGAALGFLGFISYLELNPRLTNIWYRIESDGLRHFNIRAILHYLSYPFTSTLFWQPENLDLNFITFSGTVSVIYSLVRHLIDFI